MDEQELQDEIKRLRMIRSNLRQERRASMAKARRMGAWIHYYVSSIEHAHAVLDSVQSNAEVAAIESAKAVLARAIARAYGEMSDSRTDNDDGI